MRAPRASAIACACALLCAACGDAFEGGAAAGQGGAGGGGTTTTSSQGSGGGAPPEPGCSDGVRELFVDIDAEPNVAGCAGGFELPGVVRPETQLPKCQLGAGDDGDNVAGTGCTVADFCAKGWHVCRSQVEFAERSSSGCPAAAPEHAYSFWITRQAQNGSGQCEMTATTVNNTVGCGYDYGLAAHATCNPLDRVMSWSHCAETMAWQCGDMGDPNQEAHLVHKDGPEEGGVLCCRD